MAAHWGVPLALNGKQRIFLPVGCRGKKALPHTTVATPSTASGGFGWRRAKGQAQFLRALRQRDKDLGGRLTADDRLCGQGEFQEGSPLKPSAW
jgi:hypothetical protein